VSRVEQQSCWVLHRRAWRESSLLLELFSEEFGRIGLVARGARGARSAWRGLAEPFVPLTAGWMGRGELGTLTGLEPTGQRVALKGRALWCGLYANELLLKLLARDDAAPTLFTAYGQLLEGLGAELSPQANLLRRFELALLGALGVVPDLHHDAMTGQPVEPDQLYHVRPETGLVAVAAPGRDVFSGRAALVLTGQVVDDAAASREARTLTRLLLDHQLGGKPLKTRELFAQGQRPEPK
jgi:DNA repair protein RecO (recombination protein O)